MSNLAASRSEAAGLPDGVWGEIVVEHEAVAPVALDVVQDLLIEHGAQGGDGQGLGFASREQGRTMGARQESNLTGYGSDFLEATPVDTKSLVQDGVPEDVVLEVLHEGGKELALDFVDKYIGELRFRLLDGGAHGGAPLLLDLDEECYREALRSETFDFGRAVQGCLQGCQGTLFLAGQGAELLYFLGEIIEGFERGIERCNLLLGMACFTELPDQTLLGVLSRFLQDDRLAFL